MNRRELREQIFKLLFRVEFNSEEEMPAQCELFFDDVDTSFSKEDADYIQNKFDNIYSKLGEIDKQIDEKAKENVHAKSLRTFITESFAEKHLKGVRFSMKPYIDQEWMENVPLYGTEAFIRKEGLGCID